MRKICSKCKKRKQVEAFSRKRGGRAAHCKTCQSNYNKRHYINNKSRYRERNYKWRLAIYSKLNIIKNKPCIDCGNTYPPCAMDFDHVKGKKAFTIGTAAYGGLKSWKCISEEIKKCELVCSNCHRIRTHKRKYGSII